MKVSNRTCSICNHKISRIYCEECGQKLSRKPVSITTILVDFIENIFSLQKSVLVTVFKTIITPREIILNYCNGYSRYYPSPGRMLVFAAALIGIHALLIGDEFLGVSLGTDLFFQFGLWVFLIPLLTFSSYICFLITRVPLSWNLISISYASASSLILMLLISDFAELVFQVDFGPASFIAFLILTIILNTLALTRKKSFLKIIIFTSLQIGILVLIVLWTSSINYRKI